MHEDWSQTGTLLLIVTLIRGLSLPLPSLSFQETSFPNTALVSKWCARARAFMFGPFPVYHFPHPKSNDPSLYKKAQMKGACDDVSALSCCALMERSRMPDDVGARAGTPASAGKSSLHTR